MAQNINESVRLRGEAYFANDPESARRLEANATQDELDSLKDRKLISGDWQSQRQSGPQAMGRRTTHDISSQQGPAGAFGQTTAGEPAQQEPATQQEGESGSEPLPSGFPARMTLAKAGYNTIEKVRAASDKELEDLEGVGEATVRKIREELK